MAEPLSVASGIAGIVSLGITLCKSIYNYLEDFKSRGADIASASERTKALELTIESLQKCAERLDGQHASFVASFVRSCESELAVLAGILNRYRPELNIHARSKRNRLKDKNSALLYPLNRRDIIRLEDQLSRTTATLCVALQVVILDAGANVAEDIRKLNTSVVEACGSMEQSIKRDLQSITDTARLENERTEEMSMRTRRMIGAAQTALASQNTEALDRITMEFAEQSTVLHKILSTSELRQEAVSQVQRYRQPDTSSNLLAPTGDARGPGTPRSPVDHRYSDLTRHCTCRPSRGNRGYQSIKVTLIHRGDFTYSRRNETFTQHHPQCAFYHPEQSRRSDTRELSITGFISTLLSRFILLSVTCISDSRGYSIAPTLRVSKIVNEKESFAFRPILEDIRHLHLKVSCSKPEDSSQCRILDDPVTTEALDNIKSRLHLLYSSGKASPLEINESGYNIAHLLIQELYQWFANVVYGGNALVSLRSLLRYCRDSGVNFNATTLRQETVLGMVNHINPDQLVQVYDLLDDVDSETPSGIRSSYAVAQGRIEATKTTELFHRRTDIAEAVLSSYFPTLGNAILRRSRGELESLLSSSDAFVYLSEKGPQGQTALHLCIWWPAGLQILLAKKETLTYLNHPDYSELQPMMYALISSGYLCSEENRWAMCQDCACSASLELLLANDCSICIHKSSGYVLRKCSLKARVLFLTHLKNRLLRLQAIARSILPSAELEKLQVPETGFSDTRIRALLAAFLHRGVQIPDALSFRIPSLRNWSADILYDGLYCIIDCPRVAELAYDLGFRDFDLENDTGQTPLIRWCYFMPQPEDGESLLRYFDWLIKRGSRLDQVSGVRDVPAAYYVATVFGEWIALGYKYRRPIPDRDSGLTELCSTICNMSTPGLVFCACGVDNCCLPFNALLAASQDCRGSPAHWCLDVIDCTVYTVKWLSDVVVGFDTSSWMRSSIFRYMTMERLGVRHLCRRSYSLCSYNYIYDKRFREWQSECQEIQEEDRELVSELDALTREFEEEYARRNIPLLDFLKGYWSTRMEEIQKRHSEPLTQEQISSLKEVGVILQGA